MDPLTAPALDPDELAILEAARIAKSGRTPIISFVIGADNKTIGFRVYAEDDWEHGRFFACTPIALSQSMCNMIGGAMERAARHVGKKEVVSDAMPMSRACRSGEHARCIYKRPIMVCKCECHATDADAPCFACGHPTVRILRPSPTHYDLVSPPGTREPVVVVQCEQCGRTQARSATVAKES